jgi:hypothetical protein
VRWHLKLRIQSKDIAEPHRHEQEHHRQREQLE